MTHPLTKKARGYCPHLKRDHSIRIEGIGNAEGAFKKERMTCSDAGTCGSADEACPIYRQIK